MDSSENPSPESNPEPIATPPAEAPVEEPQAEPATEPEPKPLIKIHHHWKAWIFAHKKLSVLAALIILLGIIWAVPWSRYQLAGLALKQNYSVKVYDSLTNTPVSGATVSSGGVSATTDASGQATLKLKDGHRVLSISKTYYNSTSLSALVPVLHQKSTPAVSLVANGRQAAINVTNRITGQALAAVNISVAGVSAKTDENGDATVVLPAGQATQSATLSLSGYNDAKLTVNVSDKEVVQNKFSLTPAGRVYFLSNASGTLDIVSTNLDGSGQKTVFAGTGNEDSNTTALVVSPDNKYLALETNRTGANPLIYMVNAGSGAASLVDKSNSSFETYGWLGDDLIYTSSSNDPRTWLQGSDQLKSYDAANGQTKVLAKSSAVGNAGGADYQSFGFVSLTSSGTIIYSKDWQVDYNTSSPPNLSGKQNSLNQIKPDGTAGSVIASYSGDSFVSYSQYAPNYIYIQKSDNGGNATYYSYQIGGGAPTAVSISYSAFYKNYAYYYLSPNYQQVFWSEVRDGKNTLLVGDSVGGNAKTLDNLSDFDSYGWFDNNYVLLSKNNDELYVQSASGKGQPVKISEYEATSGPGSEVYSSAGRGGGGY